jgi:hypothetical protein
MKEKGCALLGILLVLTMLAGEVQCFVKMVRCNWSPVGKAEVLYTMGTFTFTGCIIGWFDIEDK